MSISPRMTRAVQKIIIVTMQVAIDAGEQLEYELNCLNLSPPTPHSENICVFPLRHTTHHIPPYVL